MFKIHHALFLLLMASLISACTLVKDTHPLSLGYSTIDQKLLSELEKNFYKHNKVKMPSFNKDSIEAISSILNQDIDLYLGNIDLSPEDRLKIKEVSIAKDGIVLVTNPKNPVNNLSEAQVQAILERRIRNWKRLGGNDAPIMFINNKEQQANKAWLLKALYPKHAQDFAEHIAVQTNNKLKQSLAKFPNAIGYLSFSEIDTQLKALSYNNIAANSLNISKGYFPLARPLHLYYSKDAYKKKSKRKSINAFIQFIHSQKGQSVILTNGFMPLTEAELQIIRATQTSIKIGCAVPLEGAYMELGRSIINAAKLHIEEINSKGGIHGKELELIICNDKAEINAGLECANKFIEEQVSGVIGHVSSSVSIEASKIYTRNKIVQISPASTHPWFTERTEADGYVFRTAGRDDQQAKLIVDLLDRLNLPRPIPIKIFNNGTIYATNLNSLIENLIKERKLDELLGSVSFKREQKQYQKELAELEAKVIIFLGEYGDAAHMVKELALGDHSDVIFIGADGTFLAKDLLIWLD